LKLIGSDALTIEESGWNPPQLSDEELLVLQKQLQEVLDKIKNHPSAWPFLKPVDRREVPDYYDVIKDPLGMIFDKIL
jgi:histone acetyltransferase